MIDIAEKEYKIDIRKTRTPAVRQGKEVTGSPIGQILRIAQDKQTDVLQKNWRKRMQKSASDLTE